MRKQRIDYWDAIALAAQADGMASFSRGVRAILRSIEFGALYFLAPVVADRNVGRVLWNVGFPKAWEAEYNKNLRWIDPLPDIGLEHPHPFRWSDCAKLAELDEAGSAYLKDMGEGVAVHCTAPMARSGFVGVGRPKAPEALSDEMVRRIGIAAQLCFQRYCALVGSFGAQIPDLSQRELDVVRWIGEGKSNAVIADILEISKHSVDSYVQRIFAKLDVSDRTAAAVKAVALGLIAPGRHSKQTYRARWVP